MSGKDKDKDKQEKQSTTERLVKGECCVTCRRLLNGETTCSFLWGGKFVWMSKRLKYSVVLSDRSCVNTTQILGCAIKVKLNEHIHIITIRTCHRINNHRLILSGGQ